MRDPELILVAEVHGRAALIADSWTSEGALRAHYTTAHYRRYREQVGPLLAQPAMSSSITSEQRFTRSIPTRPTQGSWDEDANCRHLSGSGVCFRAAVLVALMRLG